MAQVTRELSLSQTLLWRWMAPVGLSAVASRLASEERKGQTRLRKEFGSVTDERGIQETVVSVLPRELQ